MIRDLLEGAPTRPRTADVCIVGAGAAGIALAVEFGRLGKTVTLLEGGGRVLEDEAQKPYVAESEALPHRGLHAGRFRVLGGTTTKWGGQILELDRLDFERRSWVPESGWPFEKSELVPYYARALELEGLSGARLRDDSVWACVGNLPSHFNHLRTYVSRWCPEPNFANLHGATLRDSPSIEVWVHANAVELKMENDVVQGVRCRTQSGIEATFTAVEYIACLGAIESARFFLQPRNGRIPWNESGLLGKHFQDHIDCNAATVIPVSCPAFHQTFDSIFLNGYKYTPKVKFDERTQREQETLSAGATFFSSSQLDDVMVGMKSTAKRVLGGKLGEIKASDAWRLVRHSPLLMHQAYRYSIEHRAYHPPSAELKMRVHCEQEPDSSSAITLSDERDEFGMLRTKLAWKISPMELRTIRSFVQVAQRSLAGLAQIVPDADLMAKDNRFVERCEDSFHHMGGMRMHDSPHLGVVDSNLKLHGTRNGYVCSSAVFPTSGFSNPTHTVLALAVRLARRLGTKRYA